ncbi:hypothetical protein OIU84_026126 [Salix udensis]|uniref:Uncharacterized protein n=1 Tax=Salix udensis TaxID=889485 RepID=A0AAD6PDG2_9ROSI|nr:hypothetical protein OIU84_026126 [Salix udensis]
MEFKSTITAVFLLFLLLATPHVSRGGSGVADSEEVYEIDYRGPETHSSVKPPPGHFHGRPWIHQDAAKTSHKPQGFRGGDHNGEQAKKIHG